MTNRTQKIIIGVVIVAVLGLFVIGLVTGVAVYGWQKAKRAGNEAATVQNLKTIMVVEIHYYTTHDRTFGTFDQLIKEGMLTSKFAGDPAEADGYVLSLRLTPKTSSQPGSFTLNADPQSGSSVGRHFFIDSTNSMIHINPDRPAGPNDPLLVE